MRRALAIFVAFVAGWVVYMIAMMITVYDGIISMIFQPIIAVLCSGFFVALAVLVGLLLRIPPLSRQWRSSRLWALTLILGSLFILCFGSMLGITQVYMDHETGRQFTDLHPAAALGGYFALVFGLANWPFRARNTEPPHRMAAPPGRLAIRDCRRDRHRRAESMREADPVSLTIFLGLLVLAVVVSLPSKRGQVHWTRRSRSSGMPQPV